MHPSPPDDVLPIEDADPSQTEVSAPPSAADQASVVTLEALVAEEALTTLAAEVLDASLALGRNIVVVGPRDQARPLMDALVARGPERTLVWTPSTRQTMRALGRKTRQVGYLDSSRLDQALMRLELSLAPVGQLSSLRLLASVDLLVILSFAPPTRVLQVAELVLIDGGYKPRLLFARGQAPAPQALALTAAPAFVGDLMLEGFAPLAADLLRGTPSAAPGVMRPEETSPRTTAPAPFAPPSPRAPSARASTHPPAPDAGAARGSVAQSEPGWELDRLGESAGDPALDSGLDPEAAGLAALHGLEPPRRAAGAMTFEAAMARLGRGGRLPPK